MVTRFLITTLWVFSLASSRAVAENPPEVRFEIEFTKAEVYAGEPLTAHFVIYGKDDVLDVEVAKFPEFRGYWSENLALRQGPIPLLQDFTTKGWKKSIVGSYLINSMVEVAEPDIKPMKIVIRNPLAPPSADGEWLTMYSQGKPLVIKPLPPLPATLQGKFSGAVGRFTLQVERSPIMFRKDEPINLRFTLSGEGNFREVNDIPIPEIADLEVLSRKSYAQGSAQYYTKSFDITVAVHTDQNIAMPAFAFHYFDPIAARYESIPIPEISFLKAPDAVGGPAKDSPVDLGAPYATWSDHVLWIDDPLFWWWQLCLTVASLAAVWQLGGIREKIRHRWHRRQDDPWRPRLAAAQSALDTGDLDGFLGLADALAFEILSKRIPQPPVTRSELLRKSEGHIKEERRQQARALFEAWFVRAYSPTKPLPHDPNPLLEGLRALVKEAA